MFFDFMDELRAAGIKASFKEHLTLLEALDREVIEESPEAFYYLSRATFVKDEGMLDRFDQVFQRVFKGILSDYGQNPVDVPEDWLKAVAEKFLSPQEMAEIEKLGDWDAIMDTLKQRLAEQQERHEGGNKWIGTNGTSPFGNNGQNPEGIRVGGEGGQKKAVKVWEQRQYSNLDDSVEIGTRNIKMALRRLRKFARQSNEYELDMDGTIKSTAKNAGILDINMIRERTNHVKVLIFFDVGGSMDPYIKLCEELFSALKTEFKHLKYFYFHNCVYESVWEDNRRRSQERFLVQDIINKYTPDYKVIFVGDATMAPYEITNAGGSIEHWNEEPGGATIKKMCAHFSRVAWLNPVPDDHWDYTSSLCIIRDLVEQRMFPLTLKGLEDGMSELSK